MTIRIATFNVENLLARFDFSGWKDRVRRDPALSLVEIANQRDFRSMEQARVIAHADDTRQMTALAMADCKADIFCLQEVENLETLQAFEDNYLYRMTGLSFPQKAWVEGNDGRGIDVALMARNTTLAGETLKIERITSHRKKTFSQMDVFTNELKEMGFEPNDRIFRRDCLEVDLRIGGRWLTLFLCHFKSMGPFRDGKSGRDYTMPIRIAEAQSVKRIIQRKFGSERTPKMRWMVCGDLNDYRGRLVVEGNPHEDNTQFNWTGEAVSGVDPLLADGFAVDLVERRRRDDRWTLYYASGPRDPKYQHRGRETQHLVQLDYLLASPALTKGNEKAVPEIIRHGQPHRTPFPPGQNVERYPRTGWDRPKASDHCPVAVELKMV